MKLMNDNPVVRGYAWSQQFKCPPETLQAFDEVWAEIHWFRPNRPDPRSGVKVSNVHLGLNVDDQTIQLELTNAQTRELRDGGYIMMDFKRIRGGVETYLGAKAKFPVYEPITKGALG